MRTLSHQHDEECRMSRTQEVTVTEAKETAPLTAQEIKRQVQLIQEVMQAVMQEGYHYGVIPGTEKPTLLKPGAEKLTTTFRLAPLLHVEARELANGHREYQVRCTLVHIPTERVYGEGVGLCSTLESRYRYRNAGNRRVRAGAPRQGGAAIHAYRLSHRNRSVLSRRHPGDIGADLAQIRRRLRAYSAC